MFQLNTTCGLDHDSSLFSGSRFIQTIMKRHNLRGILFSTFNTDLPDVQEEFPFLFDKDHPIPVLLLHGDKSIHREGDTNILYKEVESKTHWRIELPPSFQVEAVIPCEEEGTVIKRTKGAHHCKYILVFTGDDDLYVILTTANLVESRTLDMSQIQKFSCRDGVKSSKSCSDFGIVLWDFLQAQSRSMALFAEYSGCPKSVPHTPVEFLKKKLGIEDLSTHFDFSHAVGDLIASVPGTHTDSKYGLYRLRELLTKRGGELPKTPLHRLGIQVTTIGDNLGEDHRLESMLGHFIPEKSHNLLDNTDLIWPSYDYIVKDCPSFPFKYRDDLVTKTKPDFFTKKVGGPLFLTAVQLHELGSSIRCCFRKFESDKKIYPHLKTYFRRMGNEDDLAWVLLTSSNLSTGAWGMENDGNLHLRNFELGVLVHSTAKHVIKISDIPFPYKTNNLKPFQEVDEDGDIIDSFVEYPYMHCLYGFKSYTTFASPGMRAFKRQRII